MAAHPTLPSPVSTSLLLLLLLLLSCCSELCAAATVSYDHRAVVIDGKRRVLISGSIHYPRSTPEMWPDLIQKSKDGGLDVIETYVFWNLHEPVQGQYDFGGRKDLVKFIKTVAAAGLYVHLRIGPYVCAEWNYGGFPVWLHFIPNIKFRIDNDPFKNEMQKFTTKIVDMMKQEMLFAFQGGPIILSQIENEYGNVEKFYGPTAKSYIDWAASMATSLNVSVPWVMCQQDNAPDPIINTCNGFYCDNFKPNSDKKPKMWTENWSGWFLSFGGGVPYRPVEDLAFAVARFFQRGGTFQNYYMYHGGTNFGRTSGGPFIATSYDYDSPIDEYGLLRQPKWGHLRDLHIVIKQCEEALVATDPTYTSLGKNLEAHVYRTSSGRCAAFLANIDDQSDATVTFNGKPFHLPAWSVSILPDCQNVAFNTAKINSQTTVLEMKYTKTYDQAADESTGSSEISESEWKFFTEPIGSINSTFKNVGLLEQINTTADSSDYLWYSISIDVIGNEPFLFNGTQTTLHVDSLGHVLHVFVNGKLSASNQGSNADASFKLENVITLSSGQNRIDLLSATVGLKNYGQFFDLMGAGITGVILKNHNATRDLSSSQWTYQIGLKGEQLALHDNTQNSTWMSVSSLPKNQPLTWYMTYFDAPEHDDPVAIDFTGMGKGEAWVNGHSIGRYWPTYTSPPSGCVQSCDYRGPFSGSKCVRNCGQPSQSLYHVPRSLIQQGNTNRLVLFEEVGGDPTLVSFALREARSLCAHVSQSHPPPVDAVNTAQKKDAVLHLECPHSDRVISSVKFASFGTPHGTCGSYSHGNCSSTTALAILQQACIGVRSCDVKVSTEVFGDPCRDVVKSLAVEASCS
ncbi:unnamed protein product [Musa acuminata subsp. burmannicoides]